MDGIFRSALLLGLSVFCGCTVAGRRDGGLDGCWEEALDGGDEVGGDPGGELEATSMPLGPAAVFRVGEPGGVDVDCAAFTDASGGLQLVWENFDAAFTQSRLLQSRSTDGTGWSQPAEVALGHHTFHAGPSVVSWQGASWLYFVDADGLYTVPTLSQAAWQDSGWGSANDIPGVSGLSSLLSWPKVYLLKAGQVALVFRDGGNHPRLAESSDGRTFLDPLTLSSDAVAMVAMGQFGLGELAYSYQTGNGSSMISWVLLSSDGITWSNPVRVSTSSDDVHDTTLVRRLDGDLDLYYIYPCSAAGFCLFRRDLTAGGILGPEQQVTAAEVVEPSKPEGFRLGDGRLLLVWAAITRRDAMGNPIEQVLHGTLVVGDSPQPK